MRAIWTAFPLIACALCMPAQAEENASALDRLEVSGYVSADARLFFNDLEDMDRDDRQLQPSLVIHPEFRFEWNEGLDRLTLILHARLDPIDPQRTHFDIREATYTHSGEDWDLTVGVGKVFWGVTESHHLVDIVNQTDLVEHPDGEEKLGQPMINLNLSKDWGALELFALFGYRERTYPGREGRLRDYFPTVMGEPQFEFPDDRSPVEFAARYGRTLGDWDMGVSYFHGTQRNPRLPIVLDAQGRPIRVAYYGVIDQVGVDIQATKEAWLYKLEAISRWGDGDKRITAAVGGIEYTMYDLFEIGADLGLIVEYLYDDRDRSASATPYDDDVFVGTRVALNDADDTSLLTGVYVDRNHGGITATIEGESRLTESLSVKASGVFIFNTPFDDVLGGLRRDDFVEVRMLYYF